MKPLSDKARWALASVIAGTWIAAVVIAVIQELARVG